MRSITAVFPLILACVALPGFAAEVIPLERGHSHNDYLRKRPLLDALDNGMCSVEADIHLVDGKLLVAHDLDKTDPASTLQSLYLDPLLARAEAHGGRVYPGGPSITLLIDIKSDGAATYEALKTILESYASILTQFTDTETREGAVTVIISGNRPIDLILADPVRFAGVDGRIPDLDGDYNAHQMPLISTSWSSEFDWKGRDTMPDRELRKLESLVKRTHERGQRIRFWALPRPTTVWPVAYAAGVDLINADNVSRLREYILSQR